MVYESKNYVIIVHLFLLIIVQAWLLSRFLNKTNRDIFNLLEAYKNNDPIKLDSANTFQKKIYNYLGGLNKKLREAEEELTKQLTYLHAVTRNAPGGLITILEDGKIDLFSDAILDMLSKRSLQSINDFIHFPDLYQAIKLIKPGEKEIVKVGLKSEMAVWLISCSIIKNNNHAIRIVSFDNIKSELDEQEIQSWQKLIRVLTHEMMNTFSPLISANETLKMLLTSIDFKLGKIIGEGEIIKIGKIEKSIDLINDRGVGITRFVEKYRQLTKLPEPIFKKHEVKMLFEELIALYDNILTNRNIKLISEVAPQKLDVFVDKDQILQVLINLIKNSIEALENISNPHINLKAFFNNSNRVVICIADNGKGIKEEDLQQIFIPFFTTRREGSGIGLSLSKQIMNKHKGEINVSSDNYKTEVSLIF